MKKIKSLCCLLAIMGIGTLIPLNTSDAQCSGTIIQFCTTGHLGDCVPIGGATGFECNANPLGGDCGGTFLKCIEQ